MSKTGRHYVKVDGRLFYIEPIDNTLGKGKDRWGDVNPATGKIEGTYGDKYVGSIHEDESIITEENGFKNIHICPEGQSPYDYINQLLKNNKI